MEKAGLILLEDLDDTFIFELRYATANNFIGKKIYPLAVCAIKKETGQRLVKAHEVFKKDGFFLKVWDAYRPLHVQRMLYEAFPYNNYVAKPPDKPITSGFRPRHNNGMAVDVTLVDRNGKELEMPSEFDDFTDKARFSSKDMSKEARKNVDYLHRIMGDFGFKSHDEEWWHFVDTITEPTTYLDIALEDFIK